MAIICFVYWLVTVVALPIMAADVYDLVRQPINALTLGRFEVLMNAAFLACGIGSFALAFDLYRRTFYTVAAPLLLALGGVLWFLLGAL